jgi:hypothetical protein
MSCFVDTREPPHPYRIRVERSDWLASGFKALYTGSAKELRGLEWVAEVPIETHLLKY